MIRKNISDRMLKTMKNQMLPERGEGCRCKGKTPKTFMCVLCVWPTRIVIVFHNSCRNPATVPDILDNPEKSSFFLDHRGFLVKADEKGHRI